MIIVGAIDCQGTNATYANPQPDLDQYEQVCRIVDGFVSPFLPRGIFSEVPPSRANFYGGTKVGFTLDYKHGYYPWIDSRYIDALEDLMHLLPFERAILYSDGASCVIHWYLAEYMKECNLKGEPSKYPHIHRLAYGRIDELASSLPSEGFVLD